MYLTRGIPASGKTTWAKSVLDRNLGTVKRVGKDDLRLMFDGSQRFGNDHAKFLTNVRNQLILNVLAGGFDVIVDETFVQKQDIDAVLDLFGSIADVTIIEFPTDLETCIERDRKRSAPVGESLIREYQEILCTNTPLLQQKPTRYTTVTYTSLTLP